MAGAGDGLISSGVESAGSDASCCAGAAGSAGFSGCGGGAAATCPSAGCGGVAAATCACGIGGVVTPAGVWAVRVGTPREGAIEDGAASSEILAGAEPLACAILCAICFGLNKNTTAAATSAATQQTAPSRSIIGQRFEDPVGGAGTSSGSSAR